MNDRLERYLYYAEKYPSLFTYNSPADDSILIILEKSALEQMQQSLYENAKEMNQPLNYMDLGILCEDEWYVVIRDLVKFPSGKMAPYIRMISKKAELENTPSCYILPYDNKKVFLQEEFRHPLRKWIWTTPRGFGEKGLSDIENAAKELREETGYVAETLTRIENKHRTDVALFLAKVDSQKNATRNDPDEAIKGNVWLTIPEFADWINDGRIDDSYSLKFYVHLATKGFP